MDHLAELLNTSKENPIHHLHKYKNGSAFPNGVHEDMPNYLMIAVVSATCCCMAYHFWDYVFRHVVKSKSFLSKEEKD